MAFDNKRPGARVMIDEREDISRAVGAIAAIRVAEAFERLSENIERHSELIERQEFFAPADSEEPNGKSEPPPKRKAKGEPQKHFELVPFEKITFDGAEEWLVKGLLPRRGVGAFFGAKSAFKSFAAQDVAMHVSIGWNWAGRRVTQAPVVYIAAEGAGGFRKRKAGFELHHAEHLPETIPFHLIAAAPNLGQGTADLEALAGAVAKAGVKPGLIVIDTLAQTLGSGEENGAGMIQLIANATALSERFGCLVLLVHHAGLTEADRLRGHSSLGCALDALVFFEPKEGALAARLTVQKLKEEADRNIALDLELSRVVIGKDCDGDEISTLIVDSVRDGKAAEPAAKKPRSQVQAIVEEFVRVYDFLSDGKPRSIGLDGRSGIRKVPVEEIRAEMLNQGYLDRNQDGTIAALSRQHFSRAKTQLLENALSRGVSRGKFVERNGKIWRIGVSNLFENTDG
jgi:AAA domain